MGLFKKFLKNFPFLTFGLNTHTAKKPANKFYDTTLGIIRKERTATKVVQLMQKWGLNLQK